jgi:rhodanese-related sulfurtransferase
MRIACFFFLLLMSFSLLAQQTTNKAFGLMVDALLKESVPTMTCTDLKQQPDAVLLDTRRRAEYDVSHLPNARWVGYDDFNLGRVADLPKTTPIVLYCSVGYRSEKIGEKLQAAGYTQVRNLYGGAFEWVNQAHPLVDSTGKATSRIHGYSRAWGIWLQRGEVVYE